MSCPVPQDWHATIAETTLGRMYTTQPSNRRKAFWFPGYYTIIMNKIDTIKNIEQDRGIRIASIHRNTIMRFKNIYESQSTTKVFKKGTYKYMSIEQKTL